MRQKFNTKQSDTIQSDRARSSGRLRSRIIAILLSLLLVMACVWLWALLALRAEPILIGTAVLAFGFGLRHAVDADHIAAIDNVTRKFMQQGRQPVSLGFFFALGHSTVVVLGSLAIALTASAFKDEFQAFREIGGLISTGVSAGFLLVIALMNIIILRGVYRSFRQVRRGEAYPADELAQLLGQGGIVARLFRPLFGMLSNSWQMYPLGFLFGLGFETATEVALLGISAEEAAKGVSLWSIMIFPALFTVAMTTIDTLDGILMIGAYGWAYLKPIRKLYYNMTITAVSIAAALLVGGVEILGLLTDRLELTGGIWNVVAWLNGNFGSMGFVLIGLFAASWAASALLYRFKGYHRLEAASAAIPPN